MVLNRLAHMGALLLALMTLTAAQPHDQWEHLFDGETGVILYNAHILPMTGDHSTGVIADGWMQLDFEGHIKALGPMSKYPILKFPTIDCEGMWLTPGLIDSNTVLGLSGHPVTGITQEQDDASDRCLPQLRALDGINPLDKAIPRVRAAGITTVYVNPGENTLISGQGALIKLRQSPDIADMILKAPGALHINLGEAPKDTWQGKGGPQTRMGTAAVIRMEFVMAQNWILGEEKHQREVAQYEAKVKAGKAKDDAGEPLLPPAPREVELKKQALADALQHKMPVIFSCHRQDDIITALRLAKEFDLEAILLHATAAWQVLPQIRDAGIPVLLGPIRTGPNSFETSAARLDNAQLVAEARLPFAIQTSGALNVRALAHEAGWAKSGGLAETEALLAITRYPAEILGVDDRIGSLAPGKDADFVLWSGHPLETTSVARYVIIEGKLVNDSDTFDPFPDGPGW
jgi:imidazolonepropionase-like amidohydrolase